MITTSSSKKISQRLEKTERRIQEEAESHSKTERETLEGTRERTRKILGSNEADKEGKERATEEAETKSRRILASVRKHHKDYHRIMARA